MTDQRTLELRVKAQLDGVKDLKSVAAAIESIEKAIEKQTAAAKRGESVYDELKASLDSLLIVQKQLKDQGSLITEFQRLEAAITKTQARVATATQRYEEYNNKLREAGSTTDAQEKKLANYGKSVEAANQALARQTRDREFLTKAFQEAGIAIDSLNSLEQRNLQLQASLGAVYQKGQQSVREYAASVREARTAERERAAESDRIQKQERARIDIINAQIAQAQKRAQEAAAAAARDQGLGKLADEAEKAAAGFTNLARGTTSLTQAAASLTPKQLSLKQAVQDLIDPTRTSRATLGALEQQVTKLSSSIGAINGPVKEYRATLDQLALAQRAAATQAGLVDEFRRQAEALRLTRAEFVQARAQVNQYAAAVRQGGDAGAQFTRPLAEAQSKLRAASEAMAAQVARTREVRTELRSAGIATNDLASAQQRLLTTVQTASNATTQLGQAVKKYGQDAEAATRGGKGLGIFGDEGRTTLSLLQRIRGEVLALTASYVGLFAVINTARGTVSASQAREGIQNQLAISVGNERAAIDAEYAYIKGQAERIGIEFEAAARGFAKFSAAASLAGRSREEIRFIFETFSEVGRVANLSTDDLNGVFKALEQVISKGKIQAEELRGQLGDRLFGAFEIAAKALKDQFPDLDKALKNGEVTANQLVLIADQYKKTVADQLPAATQSLAAQQARLNTALFDFKLAIGDSGFIDSFSKALVQITSFLRSDDGKRFAEGLGAAFKSAADAVVLVFKNIDLVIEALKIAAAVLTGLFAGAAIASILQGATAFVVLATQVQVAVKAIAALAAAWPAVTSVIIAALGVIASAVAGWKIGEYLYDKFSQVRKAATYLVTGLAEAWAYIRGSFEIALAGFPVIARNAMKGFLNVISDAVRKALSIFATFARAAGLDKLASTIDDIGAALSWNYEDIGAATAKARQDLAREVANIRAIRADMLAANEVSPDGAQRRASQADVRRLDNAQQGAVPTARPAFTPNAAKVVSDEELEKRQRRIDALIRSLDELELKTDRTQAETLATQLGAIDLTYKNLLSRIEKDIADPKIREAMRIRLQNIISELQTVTTNKFNKALADDQRGFYDKLDQLDAAAGRKQILDLQARQDAIRTKYAGLYRDLDVLREKFIANNRDTAEIDAARGRIDAGVQELVQLEEKKFKQEELNRLETRYKSLIEQRNNQIAAIRAQEDAGLITNQQAVEQINALYQQTREQLQTSIQAAIDFATANRQIFATQADYEIFVKNLEAIRARQGAIRQEWTLIEQAAMKAVGQGISNAVDGVITSMEKFATGQQSLAQGFKDVAQAAGQFAAQFLRDLAAMIIKQQIFNAMKAAGGFWGGVATAAGVSHSGGVIGSPGGRTRTVNSAWFANAPRYHSGGLMGIKQDEYPTILQRGEEVLSKDSPRNIMNGGAGLGGNTGGGAPQGMRVVLVDDRAKVPEAMNSPDGEQVIIQTIRRNVPTIKSLIGS